MKKLKRPVVLNAKIYNDLVKVFNDASCDPNLKLVRNQVIELRKKFPTYSELKESDVKFVDAPVFEYEDGSLGEIRSLIGDDREPSGIINLDILKCSIVYNIGLIRGANPKTTEALIALKIRGVPKGQ